MSGLRQLYDVARRTVRSRAWLASAFNGDSIEQMLVSSLVAILGIDRIIETGTFLGHTTYFLARKFPGMPIDTVEVNASFAARARRNLAGLRGVAVHEADSATFLSAHASLYRAGNPLFYLDAHWDSAFPLRSELSTISALPRAVIIIDDFKVPGRPDYAFAVCGGRDSSFSARYRGVDVTKIEDALDMDAIADQLGGPCDAQLYPAYRYEDLQRISGRPRFTNLVGYTVILQGQEPGRLGDFLGQPIVRRRFTIVRNATRPPGSGT